MVPLDEKTIPVLVGALAGMVAAINGIGGWIDRYSIRRRQQQAAEHAQFLAQVIENVKKFEACGASPEAVELVRTTAAEQLNSSLRLLADGLRRSPVRIPAADLSRTKRILLLYRPYGLGAWISHIIFFSCALVALVVVVAAFQNDKGDFSWSATQQNLRDYEALASFILYSGIAVLANRLAVAQRRLRPVEYNQAFAPVGIQQKAFALLAASSYLAIFALGMTALPFNPNNLPLHVFWTKRVIALTAAVVSFAWYRSVSKGARRTRWHAPRSSIQWIACSFLSVSIIWMFLVMLAPNLLVPSSEKSESHRLAVNLIFAIFPLLCCWQFAEWQLATSTKSKIDPFGNRNR